MKKLHPRVLASLGTASLLTACAGEATEPSSAPETRPATSAPLALDEAINETCPRSGDPIVADSLTEYRGVVVGFCNTHCRDDFAADPEASPEDREFFDGLIAER